MKFLCSLLLLFIGLSPIDHTLLSAEKKKTIVLICCSGKCGSWTLCKSFEKLGLETSHHHMLSLDIKNKISKELPNSNIVLIDSIRDVIARKISSFFHNIEGHTGLRKEEILKKCEQEGVGFLLELFNECMLQIERSNSFNEWKSWKFLNYDCLKDGVFDFKKKYQVKKKGNLYFVNLRFDDIKDWETIIKGIALPINLSQFKIVKANLSKHKWYYSIYNDFLRNFTLTQSTFDEIMRLNADSMAHFYTEEEIATFIGKWKPYIRD